MVEKELPVDLALVFLPKTIDSFDDVVSIVAQEINVEQDVENQPDTKGLIREIVKKLEERRQRLVIVFDEADRIFWRRWNEYESFSTGLTGIPFTSRYFFLEMNNSTRICSNSALSPFRMLKNGVLNLSRSVKMPPGLISIIVSRSQPVRVRNFSAVMLPKKSRTPLQAISGKVIILHLNT